MAARKVRATKAAVAVAVAVAAGTTACGEDENPAFSDERNAAFERQGDARREGIRKAVRVGELPSVALELIGPDGSINPNFVDGPNLGEDVVRTRDGGESGRKVEWDLDRNGRIDRDEREITERELYDASLRSR